jgi:GNAT superfamily N-acetyltransferase
LSGDLTGHGTEVGARQAQSRRRPTVRGGEVEEALATGWEASTPDGDTLALAGARAMANRAVAWADAAGGRTAQIGTAVAADARSPWLLGNAAVCVGTPAPDHLAEMVAWFGAQPFTLISPLPLPDLAHLGLQRMGYPPFMVRPPLGDPPPLPAGVVVAEVTDVAGLAAWSTVLESGFPAPGFAAAAGLLGGATRFWTARLDGEPAACACSHESDGVVSVEYVATLPAYRGRGLGEAVTWAATRADPRRAAVLVASDPGRPVYERMGYLAVMRWTLWYRG